jgi:hypothetical protein
LAGRSLRDARTASIRSFSVDFDDPKNRPALLRLRTWTSFYSVLFALHHKRRKFYLRIAEPPLLTDAQLAYVARCPQARYCDPISYVEWRELLNAMFAELET